MLPNYKSMLQVHKGKNHTSRADQFSLFPHKVALRPFCSHLQFFFGWCTRKDQRSDGRKVCRCVQSLCRMVLRLVFCFFCLGSGWILSSYHHPKIITSELFKINVGSQSQLPQNNSISMEFSLGRLVSATTGTLIFRKLFWGGGSCSRSFYAVFDQMYWNAFGTTTTLSSWQNYFGVGGTQPSSVLAVSMRGAE